MTEPTQAATSTATETFKPVIVLDFDGVIADYSQGWQGPDIFGDPIPGTREALYTLKSWGYDLVLWTVRDDTPALRAYLAQHDLPIDAVNDCSHNPPDAGHAKPTAVAYLDDRSWRDLGLPWNWDVVLYRLYVMLFQYHGAIDEAYCTPRMLTDAATGVPSILIDGKGLVDIVFQSGTPEENGVNGALLEDIIMLMLSRLSNMQGIMPRVEIGNAITCLQMCVSWLDMLTANIEREDGVSAVENERAYFDGVRAGVEAAKPGSGSIFDPLLKQDSVKSPDAPACEEMLDAVVTE